MSSQNDVELDREIEALEREIFGTPGEESIEEVIENKSPEVVVEDTKVEEVKPTDAEVKRFNNYKASTDITIRDLRTELANNKIKYANLQKAYSDVIQRVQVLERSSTKNIFSEEEIDILGEPAANALDKGVRDILESKVKPLQEELERVRKDEADRVAREANQIMKSNYDKFLDRLGGVVPDFVSINTSPGFLQYMKEADEYSGVPREHLFKKAEESLDVGRVASFFTDYKKSITPIKTKEEILQSAITPTGTPGASVASDNDSKSDLVITRAFIDKFYSDYNRGKYKTKKGKAEADRIEELIDKAVFSGQVR